MNGEHEQKSFASGVMVLTLSVMVVKVMGLVYKIPMLKILGPEGMGYFNAAYELYALFFVLSTAGLPVAVSILISEHAAKGRLFQVNKIHKVSLMVFTCLGLFGSLTMGLGSAFFAELVESPMARLCILAIAPSVFFVCVSGAMRGFFQGMQDMRPTAVSQVVEAFGKLLLGLVFALMGVKRGCAVHVCAAYGVLGVTAGSLLSMLYLLVTKRLTRLSCVHPPRIVYYETAGTICKRLVRLAIPVTLSSSLSGLSRVIDMSMILRRLQTIGYESSVAAAMYGCYSTLAVPVYSIPSALIAGISVSLVPSLTSAVEKGDAERANELVNSSLKMCLFLSLPCAFGLAVFAKPLLSLMFVGEEEAVRMAAPLLTGLAFSVCSSCLLGVTNAILQAYHKELFPIYAMLVGTVLKTVSAYFLIGCEGIGIYGAVISTLICNTAAVAVNLYYIDTRARAKNDIWKLSLPPLFASFLSVGICFGAWCLLCKWMSEEFSAVLCVLLCVVVYLYIGGRTGVYDEKEIGMLPSGEKLLVLLYRFGFLKKRKDYENEQRGYDKRACRQRTV
jgi:stage V sporulation protein B